MSISYFRERARMILAGKWGIAILVTFLASIFGAPLVASNVNFNLELDEETMAQIPQIFRTYFTIALSVSGVMGLIQFILGGVIQLGYCKFLLNLHDGENADVKDLFSQFHRFTDGFLLVLLQSIYVALWSLLFVIPGIIAAYKYAMAPFILLENPGMKANDAISDSKTIMDGMKGSLFLLDLSFIGWTLLSALTLGIGNLWLNPYMNASRAAFYRSLSPRRSFQPAAEAIPGAEEV